MSHGFGEARPIGRMVPAQAPQPAPPVAACTKCGARLSRWRAQHGGQFETTCAPCQLAAGEHDEPPDPAGVSKAEQARKAATQTRALEDHEKAAQPRLYVKCECGRGYHKRRYQRCQQCYKEARRTGSRAYRNLSVEDRLLTGKYDVCADCKTELKLKRAQRCAKCAAAARRTSGPGSRYCACGNTKGTSNEKCMECRYPNSARAVLRRMNRAA